MFPPFRVVQQFPDGTYCTIASPLRTLLSLIFFRLGPSFPLSPSRFVSFFAMLALIDSQHARLALLGRAFSSRHRLCWAPCMKFSSSVLQHRPVGVRPVFSRRMSGVEFALAFF